jgi:hypothetical protein
LERGGTKDALMERILDYLLEPKDFKKAVPAAKKSANILDVFFSSYKYEIV